MEWARADEQESRLEVGMLMANNEDALFTLTDIDGWMDSPSNAPTTMAL